MAGGDWHFRDVYRIIGCQALVSKPKYRITDKTHNFEGDQKHHCRDPVGVWEMVQLYVK